MEIVIKIDDERYKDIQRIAEVQLDRSRFQTAEQVIANGTQLPKVHGRLIDADALEKKMCDREEELGDDRTMWESSAVSVALDMFAPTIIEAEKE